MSLGNTGQQIGMAHNSNQTRRRSKWHALALTLIVIGIVAVSTWSDVVGYSSTLLDTAQIAATEQAGSLYSCGRLVISLLFVISPHLFEQHINWTMTIEAICLLFSTAGLAFAGSQSVFSPSTFMLFAAFFGGIAGTLLTAPFFILIARIAQPTSAAICVMLSLVGESVLSISLTFFAESDMQIAICCFLPVFGCACHLAALRLTALSRQNDWTIASEGYEKAPHHAEQYGPSITNRTEMALLLAELILAMIAAVLLRFLGSMGTWGLQRANYLGIPTCHWDVLIEVCLTVVCITLLFFVIPKRLSNQERCIMALLACTATLQIVIGTRTAEIPHLDAIPMAAQLICRMLQWMIFIECVNRLPLPPYRVHGIASMCNALTGLALELALAFHVRTSVLAMAFMYLFLLVTALPIARNAGSWRAAQPSCKASGNTGDNMLAETPSNVDNPELLDAKNNQYDLGEFSKRHGLSERETQVLELLVSGMTRTRIEDKLCLSEGTVRTHMNNLYHKCNVHSKGELIELIHSDASVTPNN